MHNHWYFYHTYRNHYACPPCVNCRMWQRDDVMKMEWHIKLKWTNPRSQLISKQDINNKNALFMMLFAADGGRITQQLKRPRVNPLFIISSSSSWFSCKKFYLTWCGFRFILVDDKTGVSVEVIEIERRSSFTFPLRESFFPVFCTCILVVQ